MTEGSHQTFERAWQIAESVRELPSDERQSAIESACVDNPGLRQKVEALLTTPTSAVLFTGSVQKVSGDIRQGSEYVFRMWETKKYKLSYVYSNPDAIVTD